MDIAGQARVQIGYYRIRAGTWVSSIPRSRRAIREEAWVRAIYILIIAVQVLVGLNAVAGGYAAVSNPHKPFGISPEALRRGPFEDFLIPGLFLFIVIGLGNIASAVLAIARARLYPYSAIIMASVTICWILIQCFIMETVNPMQLAILVCGMVLGFCSILVLGKEDRFPFPLLRRLRDGGKAL